MSSLSLLRRVSLLAALVLGAASPALGVTNLLFNPSIEDLDDPDMDPGDGWGAFGAASFNAFFGANGHASLFPDTVGNTGGVFQGGIAGAEGRSYQFDLLDTRIEASYDADLYAGIEYYAGDDATLLGVDEFLLNAAERLANGQTDGNIFSVKGGPAPVGTVFARPIIRFDNVNPAFAAQPQANVFVFEAYFSELPDAGGNLLKNPNFDDDFNGDNDPGLIESGDNWGTFGSAGAVQFNDLFGGNAHVSFFADTVGAEGGIFQQSVLADEGVEYEFSLDDVRIEEQFDADLSFGVEFYASDDFTKISEVIVAADTSTTGDGLSFSMTATAPVGAVYMRPIVSFGNVNPAFAGQPQANAFIFSTSLGEATDVELAEGDFNADGRVDNGDLNLLLGNWGSATVPAEWTNNFVTPVDNGELNALLGTWGAGVPAAVPEPMGLLVVAIGSSLAFQRRS